MNPCELTASVTALANALACRLNENELTLLGTVLTQLGDTIPTTVTPKKLLRLSLPSKVLTSPIDPQNKAAACQCMPPLLLSGSVFVDT